MVGVPAPQVTGEALYTDDVPLPPGTLHAALVMSTRPHAKILSIEASAALQACAPCSAACFGTCVAPPSVPRDCQLLMRTVCVAP